MINKLTEIYYDRHVEGFERVLLLAERVCLDDMNSRERGKQFSIFLP